MHRSIAAVTLQARVRACAACRKLRCMRAATATMQAQIRGALTRRRTLKRRAAIDIIQAHWHNLRRRSHFLPDRLSSAHFELATTHFPDATSQRHTFSKPFVVRRQPSVSSDHSPQISSYALRVVSKCSATSRQQTPRHHQKPLPLPYAHGVSAHSPRNTVATSHRERKGPRSDGSTSASKRYVRDRWRLENGARVGTVAWQLNRQFAKLNSAVDSGANLGARVPDWPPRIPGWSDAYRQTARRHGPRHDQVSTSHVGFQGEGTRSPS